MKLYWMNKWVLEQIKPKTSLEAKMTKLNLSYLAQFMRRQGSREKTIIVRKVEGIRARGKTNMRWTDSIREAISLSLQELSRAAEDIPSIKRE